MSADKLLLNIWPETGQRLGVSRKTVFNLANSDGFPIVKIGHRKYVPAGALEQWIAENTVTQCAAK